MGSDGATTVPGRHVCKSARLRRLLSDLCGDPMRRALLAALLPITALAAPRIARAQGWIIPRPCIIDVLPVRDVRPMPVPVRDCGANIARSRSDVRVELADRVLRYEVE